MDQKTVSPRVSHILSVDIAAWQRREKNFTCRLLDLICMADGNNLARIEKGFPDEVEAYELWRSGYEVS